MRSASTQWIEVRVVCLLAVISAVAWGQAGTGAVQGTVRDASNAVIPAADVILTNTDTNVVLRTKSTETGFFMFPSIVPGRYRLEVDFAGMQKFEGTLTLQVQQTAIIDPVLQVGQVSSTVTVQDVTPLVTGDGPTLGHVLERERIDQLPVASRDPAQLVFTVPGVVSPVYGRAYGMGIGSTDTLVDGASTVDRTFGGWQPTVRLDAVQEFKVETNNSSAKFSRPVTMVVSTRSGTNTFHGSLVETHQNSAFGSARRREDFWEKAPTAISNQWGASAGGPFFLPRLYDGRNRTFWFVSYEGFQIVSPTTRGYSVPTEAMRKGDFSGLVDSAGRRITLYDPLTTDSGTWTRQPFSHGGRLNVIDPARISPVAKYLFENTPLPTDPNVNPLVDFNLWMQVPIWARQHGTTFRLDHHFSDKDRVFVRGNFTNFSAIASAVGSSIGAAIPEPNFGRILNTRGFWNQAVSYTHVFSPTLFNEVLVSASKAPYRRNIGAPEDFAGKLGLPNPLGVAQFPGIASTGLTAMDQQSGSLWYLNQGNAMINDNATLIRGHHELQFGGSVRYEQLYFLPNTTGEAGTVNFGTLATALYDPRTPANNPGATPQTGHNLANLFLGVANYSVTFRRHTNYNRYREYAGYFQDNFRVTSRLTLNLGLRWEYYSGYREKHGIGATFDREKKAVVLGTDLETFYRTGNSLPAIVENYRKLGVNIMTKAEAGYPNNLTDPNWNNFGPRLGFAWRLGPGNRAMVLRGGYRLAYTTVPLGIWSNAVQNNIPFLGNFSNNALTSAAQSPDGVANYGMRSIPTTIAGVNSRGAVSLDAPNALTRGSASMVYFNRSQPDARIHDWNLSLESEILPDTVARVSYIGNHGAKLPSWYYFNEIPSDYIWFTTTGMPKPTGEYANVAARPYDQQVYGSIREYGHEGWSNYNGLQLELERRYSRGLAFQVFYNLHNVLATSTQGEPGDATVVPEVNQFLPGTVPTDLKARNRFLNYQRDVGGDSAFPKHKVGWNWIVDLPIGRGKRFAGNARGIVEKLFGGWQVAGLGALNSTYFTLPTSIYPTGLPVQTYGYQYPIQDCRSGSCRPGYLFWNGYIPAHQINSRDANGNPNGVMGVPADYKPAGQPLIPWPQKPDPNDPMYDFYGTNTVWVPLKNGTEQRTTFNDGLHPWRNQFVAGIWQWNLDAALFKSVKITERVIVRLNINFFNALNRPGNPNSIGSDGILSTRNSGQAARRMQATLRISW
jgi:Carboxypeptidase regulatory-like domain